MTYYKIRYSDESLSHAVQTSSDSGGGGKETGKSGSKSKYKGGFVITNNRLNNSKAYNHDYYMKNKEKWGKNKTANKVGGFISTFFSVTLTAAAVAVAAAAATVAAAAVIDLWSKWKTRDIDPNGTTKKPEALQSKKEKDLQTINRLFKYKYKVTDLFGKVRYFYTQAAYDKYCLGLKQKKEPNTIQEDIDAINPGYKTDRSNSDENCAYCTLAYDLRRRGYDVTALNEDDPGFKAPTNSDIESWYQNGKLTSHHISDAARSSGKVSTQDETRRLFDELASQGDGASGFVTAMFQNPVFKDMYSGHAMAYQVINGEAYIIDTQNGKVMNSNDFANSDYGKRVCWGLADEKQERTALGRDYCVNYMRTDNLQPSSGTAQRVKNVDGSSTIVKADDERNLHFGESSPELVGREEIERKSK